MSARQPRQGVACSGCTARDVPRIIMNDTFLGSEVTNIRKNYFKKTNARMLKEATNNLRLLSTILTKFTS